jgi:hypothetical protein
MIEDASLRNGKSFDEIVISSVATSYGKRLEQDKQQIEWFKKKVEQHQCNILTEVLLNGKIKIVDHLPNDG